MQTVGPIDVSEIKLLTASFARELQAGATVASSAWSCEAVSGVDADAATRLMGSPINGADKAQHLVGGMLRGVTYNLRCRVTDSVGLVHVAATLLTAERFAV